MTEQWGIKATRWGIRALRSANSVLGVAEGWVRGTDGKRMELTETIARSLAASYNATKTSPNISYRALPLTEENDPDAQDRQ
jgi:hypothetical protein